MCASGVHKSIQPILIPEYSLFLSLRRSRLLLPIIIAGFTQCTRLRILFPVHNHVFLTSSTVKWCSCTTAGHIEMQFVYISIYCNSSTLSWKNNAEFEYDWRWNRFSHVIRKAFTAGNSGKFVSPFTIEKSGTAKNEEHETVRVAKRE